MRDSLNTAVLAIDGGGSRCRIALASGRSVSQVETGPANVHSNFDGALAEINNGLLAMANVLKVDKAALNDIPAFVGLAGVTERSIANRVQDALPLRRARVADDRPAALRGALDSQDGAIIHCGTGSFFGLQYNGRAEFSGGWGPILGDEASAKWVGWSALNATLKALDGTVPKSGLTDALLSEFGGASGILNFAKSATAAEFGALSPKVSHAAEGGDQVAVAIMQDGADHAAGVLRALGWTDGMALVLTGGLAPQYRAYLPANMQSAVIEPAGSPLDGALSLAREVAHDCS